MRARHRPVRSSGKPGMMDSDVSGHLRKREGELPPTRIAAALAEVFSKWRSPDEPARMETIDRIADLWNCDRAGLSASFDALLEPFSSAALAELAENSISMDSCVVGMIVSGNIA